VQNEPIMDVAHLGHLELLTPKPEESLQFFVQVMGMTESGREGDSVYLHAYDDYERHSLKLTASKLPGLGHVAYRTRTPQALERRVAALKGSGFDIGWTDGDLAHGPAFLCQDPDGHRIELYYETQWYQAAPELRPALKNQAQKFLGRGINVRRLDHWNGLAVDIKANREFFENYLGFRLTEQIVMDDGSEAAIWMTCTNKSYDFAYTGACTTSPMPSTVGKRSCLPRISVWKMAFTLKPVLTSTQSSRPSSCMCTNLEATALRLPMPERV
jgi:catechol 2,3-dioxygenase